VAWKFGLHDFLWGYELIDALLMLMCFERRA